jgi:DNA (cytosine-5)-methyltransferase 1
MSLTMGSLFDGIGGFPLAASHVGIKTLWASEIEPFPIKVTMERFPEMVHVGDITKLKGADLPPVDIICGGSPCQNLSVAGNRNGLKGSQSGLFYEMIRVIKELRNADRKRGRTAQSVRPRWCVWENVPGAYSSGEPPGEDFRIVLESFAGISLCAVSIPRPESGKWKSAGRILLGDTFSLAWRTLDAQYWGVAQRRARVYLIVDFAGGSAPKILFDEKGLFGDTPQVEGAWETSAATAGAGAEDTGRDDTS